MVKKRRIISFILFIMVLAVVVAPANAAELGMILIPKNMSSSRVENFISAVEALKSLNLTINLSLWGGHELEPTQGTYNVKERLGGFNYFISTVHPKINYMGVSLINTNRRDMSDDLVNVGWADPLILKRFSALLDKIAENLKTAPDVFLLGNEVDIYLAEHPLEVDAYIDFIKKASALIKLKYPKALTGASVTYEGMVKDRKEVIAKILGASDEAFVTYYPLAVGAKTRAAYQQGLTLILNMAEKKDVYLQEVGFPSDPLAQSSEALQADFISQIIPLIDQYPRIKIAVLFALHDIDKTTCDQLTQYYGFTNVPRQFVQGFIAMLGSLGFKTSDGREKSSFTALRSALVKKRTYAPLLKRAK